MLGIGVYWAGTGTGTDGMYWLLVRAVGDYGRMDPKMRKHSLQIDRTVFQLRPGGGKGRVGSGIYCGMSGQFPSLRRAASCCLVVVIIPQIELARIEQDRTERSGLLLVERIQAVYCLWCQQEVSELA